MEQRSAARANIPPHRAAVGSSGQAAEWFPFPHFLFLYPRSLTKGLSSLHSLGEGND
jgi:hypothetical protein